MRKVFRGLDRKQLAAKLRALIHPTLLAAAATLALAVTLGAQAQQSQPAAPAEKTAAQQFKNIQVLKDTPASQLIPGMRYITSALGVECNFCHVQDNFASDDKQEKQTARKMMTMMFAINNNNFGGRPQVSCFTCHQGHNEPMGVPALPAEAVEPQFSQLAQGAPTVDAILAKFAQAKGGADALSKINTRVIQLDQTTEGHTSSIEAYQKAPGEMYSVVTTQQGNATTFCDGTHAWITTNRGSFEANGFDAIVLSREAQMNPIAALQNYKAKRLRGQAKVGDQMTYIVQATAPDGIIEFLFFDQQSGLLVRRMIRDRTIFGALPIEADYSDFRQTDGVNIPYKITWYTNGRTETYMVKSVKDNAPVDDSKFAPPQGQGRE
ncbi:MAG TPA: c-type cytochrome [Candidatus Acidoferrales bacterium]|nr:c-type cytochrome [Candidatus Acidoferrales bacterium]